MSRNNTSQFIAHSIVIGVLFPFVVFAQSDGSAPPSSTAPADIPAATVAVPTTATTSAPRSAEPRSILPTTTNPRAVVPVPQPVSPIPVAAPSPINSIPQATSNPSPVENTNSDEDMGSDPILWVALAALAILPLGYVVAQAFQNKKTKEDKKDDTRCFNIKKLMEDKLKELTDLKGKIENKAQDKAREAVKGVVKDTAAAELLAMLERAEKEYGRLKQLYEKCVVEFSGGGVKGIIFDLDMCILDTRTLTGSFFQPVLDALYNSALSQETKEKVRYQLWTTSLDDVIAMFALPKEVSEKMREAYRHIEVPDGIKSFGDEDVLRDLSVKKFLVTSGYRKFQETKIAKLGIAYLFDEIIIDALDEPEKRKGKKKIFQEILEGSKLDKGEALVVGDNPESELGAGKSLGIKTVQTLRPTVIRWEEADYHIVSLRELEALI